MKITKYPASMVNVNISGEVTSNVLASVSSRPYVLVAETQLTVGIVAAVVATPPAGFTYTFMFVNRSAAAQIIRTGFAPAFGAPNVGISTLVNEVVIWENVNFAISIVSNGAGALVDTLVLSQTV